MKRLARYRIEMKLVISNGKHVHVHRLIDLTPDEVRLLRYALLDAAGNIATPTPIVGETLINLIPKLMVPGLVGCRFEMEELTIEQVSVKSTLTPIPEAFTKAFDAER